MSDYFFFLSYARSDRDLDKYNCIRRFCKDLEEEVRRLKGPVPGKICFFDGEDIEPGNKWPDTLSEALCTSRVFVPIYSPTYFTKDYCGREWKLFSDRVEAYKRQNPTAVGVEELIQPVLLTPSTILPQLPPCASDIQYLYDQYPENYRTEGLSVLSRVGVYRDDYVLFIYKFAQRIIEVAEKHSLPSQTSYPDIKKTISAFHSPGMQLPGAIRSTPGNVGPRYVQFIFVAGKDSEMKGVRERLDYYGPEGGLDWKPFLPEFADEVCLLAQEIAAQEKLRYEAIPLNLDIIHRLEEASQNNKIVVIIVDTWTLRLEPYHTRMRQYDERDFLNCVVLIPWNLEDFETLSRRPELKNTVEATFQNKCASQNPHYFVDTINSLEELRKQLTETLNKARARIIQRAEVVKRAESGRVIAQPIIFGPGGR